MSMMYIVQLLSEGMGLLRSGRLNETSLFQTTLLLCILSFACRNVLEMNGCAFDMMHWNQCLCFSMLDTVCVRYFSVISEHFSVLTSRLLKVLSSHSEYPCRAYNNRSDISYSLPKCNKHTTVTTRARAPAGFTSKSKRLPGIGQGGQRISSGYILS